MAGKLTLEQLAESSVFEIGKLIAKGLEPATPAVEKFVNDYKKSFNEIKNISLGYTQLEKDFKVAPNRQRFNQLLKEKSVLTEQMNAAYKEQNNIEKNLIKTIERKNIAYESTNKALIKERYELQQLNKRIKDEAILNSKSSSEIQKLEVKRRRAIRTIQDLTAKKVLGVKLSNKEQRELRQSTRLYQKYDKAIRIAKNTTGQFQENVGNYPKTISIASNALRKFIPLIGLGFGVREAFNLAGEMYQTAKEARGVEFAFQRLGASAETNFARVKRATRGLLSDLDIKKALVEFDNFNLSGEQLDTVLEFVSVRAVQTGKSFEYLRDSAIEAISKESVRRADNLGLSQKELNDKIKEGASFLEAFSSIAKREIKEAGGILDEASSAQQRFNAELENFKVSAGSGFIRTFTDSIYEIGTAFVSVAKDINDASDGFWSFLKNIGRATTIQGRYALMAENAIKKEKDLRKKLTEQILEEETKKGISQKQRSINEQRYLKTHSDTLRKKIILLEDESNKNKEGNELAKLQNRAKKLGLEYDGKNIEQLKKIISLKLKSIKEDLNSKELLSKKENYELSKFYLEQEIKKQKEVFTNEKSNYDERLRAIQLYEDKRIELTELKEEYLLSSEKVTRIKRKLIEEKTSAELIAIYDKTNKEIKKLQEDIVKNAPETIDLEGLEDDTDILKQSIKDYAKLLGIDGEEALKEFEKLHGQSFEKLADYYKKLDRVAKESGELRKEIERDVAESAIEFVNVLFDRKIVAIQDEISANNQKYELLIANTQNRYDAEGNLIEDSEKRRQLLEAEKLKKEKELQKKESQERRKQAIFNKLMAVTEIGINLAKTISAINLAAATIDAISLGLGGTPYKAINIPLAIASSSLQVASVVARPIPKYKHGKPRSDNYEGIALVNDGGKQEFKEDKAGNVYAFRGVNQLAYVGRDDIIHKDKESLLKSKGINEDNYYRKLESASILASLQLNGKKAKEAQKLVVVNNNINEQFILKAIEKNNVGLKKEIQNGFKNINISNTIKIDNQDSWARG